MSADPAMRGLAVSRVRPLATVAEFNLWGTHEI
jgi:hypothetical protein